MKGNRPDELIRKVEEEANKRKRKTRIYLKYICILLECTFAV
jgi:hypothetical protein